MEALLGNMLPITKLALTHSQTFTARWLMVRELMSALTPDFTTILHNGKLDREAIQDCAAFLQEAVGRKRDRNANMWGILLYFLLIINMLFQGGRDDQIEVFEWMIKSVTRSAYELNNHASLLEQFVLAVNKMWTTRCNPLGRETETLFFHNYRTTCSPHAAVFHTAGATTLGAECGCAEACYCRMENAGRCVR